MTEQFGPLYNVVAPSLAKHRRLASNGLQSMTWEQRCAYGEAVERAILTMQRRECLRALPAEQRPNCASRSWANKPGEVGAAIREQHHRALAACASAERRARSDAEWASMYEEAMQDKARRIAEHLLAGGTLEWAA